MLFNFAQIISKFLMFHAKMGNRYMYHKNIICQKWDSNPRLENQTAT